MNPAFFLLLLSPPLGAGITDVGLGIVEVSQLYSAGHQATAQLYRPGCLESQTYAPGAEATQLK